MRAFLSAIWAGLYYFSASLVIIFVIVVVVVFISSIATSVPDDPDAPEKFGMFGGLPPGEDKHPPAGEVWAARVLSTQPGSLFASPFDDEIALELQPDTEVFVIEQTDVEEDGFMRRYYATRDYGEKLWISSADLLNSIQVITEAGDPPVRQSSYTPIPKPRPSPITEFMTELDEARVARQEHLRDVETTIQSLRDIKLVLDEEKNGSVVVITVSRDWCTDLIKGEKSTIAKNLAYYHGLFDESIHSVRLQDRGGNLAGEATKDTWTEGHEMCD